jgi:hypothetical protein
MMNIPQDFDWVQARANCSIAVVFKQLQLDIEGDIQAVNAARELPPSHAFQLLANTTGNVFVVSRPSDPNREVKFFLIRDQIDITGLGMNLVATLTLNNEGRCKLKIGEEELERWQVRRMTLERLFFESAKP